METYALKYNTTRNMPKKRVEVNIRLNDECKNGHAEFAITGTVYEQYANGHWYDAEGGCIHDVIAKYFPKFQLFIALHLCDAKGAPMYAQVNGFYHLRNSPREMTMKYLRITDQEYDRFSREAEDQLYFTYLLQTMGIPARWEEEARAAIRQLEELTCDTFVDHSERYQFTPLTDEEFQLIETRIAEGYYTPAAIRKRKAAALRAKNKAEMAELRAEARNAKLKIDRELGVNLLVKKLGMPLDNFIYYAHNNTGVFNWLPNSLRTPVTPEQFNDFLCRVDYRKLPEGIQFQLKPAS